MDCNPPDQMTMTMPMLTHMVSAGVMLDMNRMTRIERSVRSSLAASKRSPS